jgi:chaperonin cofactor prefoldin
MEKIKERMSALAEEADTLYQRKLEIESEHNKIETRLAQIVGALQELDSILKMDNFT